MDALFEDPQRCGEAIRKARTWAKMSQAQLAAELGTTRQRLSKIEQGKEPKGGRKPAERRVLVIAVAEITGGPRSMLGLSEPEPGEVDQLAYDFEQKLLELKNELRAEAAKERELLEARLTSLESAVRNLK